MITSETPHALVDINGNRYDSWAESGLLMSAEVNLTTDKSSEGVIEIYDPNFKVIDRMFQNVVNSLTANFYFSFKKDVGAPVFSGILARTEWNDNVTTLRFHDNSIRMKQEKRNFYHKKKTDIQILRDLAHKNGLEFKPKSRLPESQPFTALMQAQKTDWEFALKIAKQSGLLLYVSGNTLFAVEAGTTKIDSSSATLSYADNDFALLRDFGLSYKLPKNRKGRIKAVAVRGRGKDGKAVIGKAGKNDDGISELVSKVDLPSVSVARAEQRARSRIGKQKEYAFEHHIQTLPLSDKKLNLRDTITIAGMGAFYSGDYAITELSYRFAPGKLICEMTIGRDLADLKTKKKK